MKKLMLILSGLLLPISGWAAAPEISVGTLSDYVDADKSNYLKRVRNSGDATAFVKIEVKEIIFNSDGKSEEVPVTNMDKVKTNNGHTLVASPARLIIPAKAMQSVRLLVMGDRNTERYYRVRYIPVMPELKEGFNVTEQDVGNYKKTLTAGVNILAGYGTVVYVRPQQVRFNSTMDMKATELTIRNEGNSVIYLDHFKLCDSSGNKCETATKHHILPGKTRSFPKTVSQKFHFDLVEGEKSQRILTSS